MIFEGGDSCSDNFQRTTVINFVCNQNAGNYNAISLVNDIRTI